MTSSSSTAQVDSNERRRVELCLLAEASVSKSALARVLQKLHAEGCLVKGTIRSSDSRSIRRDLSEAGKALANVVTPFGCLVQTMVLNTPVPLKWPFLHPLALIFFLSQRSGAFRALLEKILAQYGQLSSMI